LLKIVGDNPFHGVSHVSQARASNRNPEITQPEFAAKLVALAIGSGADGFMFSISDTTLSILKLLHEKYHVNNLGMYAITPAAQEVARLMGPAGGVDGTVKQIAKKMVWAGNLSAVVEAMRGVVSMKWENLMQSYLLYESSRIQHAAKRFTLSSIMLHEIVTDLALSLNLEEFFLSYISFSKARLGTKPGFETRNFVLLVEKFREWGIDLREVVVAAPFNKIGFQMVPSKDACEMILASIEQPNIIAISALAAGYLPPAQAFEYIKKLNIQGVAVAVSKEAQAAETFGLLSQPDQ
jgi:hypothetical protein